MTEAFFLSNESRKCCDLARREGKFYSCQVLYRMIAESLDQGRCRSVKFWGLKIKAVSGWKHSLQSKESIDVVIPRGGDSLIHFVRTPLVDSDDHQWSWNVPHLVDASAELEMAVKENILLNAKVQRPGVCNAVETLLIHKDVAAKYLPVLYQHLSSSEVQWFACPESFETLKGKKMFFLRRKKLWYRISGFKTQCACCSEFGNCFATYWSTWFETFRSDCDRGFRQCWSFLKEVDAAAVYWNASTRFTDGYQLGLGGEVGISTKTSCVVLVGLQATTSPRWILRGHGHIRG